MNECLEIRNKRIINLEIQVGHASDMIGGRSTPENPSADKLRNITDKLEVIFKGIEKLQTPQSSNNIVINPCQSSYHLPKQNCSTQTDDKQDTPDSGARPGDEELQEHGDEGLPEHGDEERQERSDEHDMETEQSPENNESL